MADLQIDQRVCEWLEHQCQQGKNEGTDGQRAIRHVFEL